MQRPGRRTGLLLFLIAAAGLLICSLLSGVLALMLPGMDAELLQLAYDFIYYGLFAVLPIVLYIRRRRGLAEALRPNPVPFFATISTVSIAMIAVFLINDLTVLWAIPFQKMGFNVNAASFAMPQNTRGLMISVISIAAIPSICEELLFRGMIMPAFERHGSRHAMVVSSLLFAVLHGSLIGAPGQFLLGLVLAALVVYNNSIYIGMIFHMVYNASLLILQFLQERYVSTPPVEDYLTAIGGLPGVLELLLSCGLSLLLIGMMLRMMRLRSRIVGIQPEPRRPEKLRKSEVLLLIGGIAVCLLLYAADIFAMLL